ncbi:MAG: helix-turn-helix domain-containing protein [Woeseia sp.]|nr:helix-turn-helix domain-containing protein [Woeseia sp.]MBU2678557.1 helix-turn-helix domain-containing protein [Gammaproteobacteria bacterium]NNL52291.1 helix-turn-helix domain-containing protein [Woeseiaceae bacterium]MBT8097270.1 helix-turn-helix domain-containing protein [Woeseia sp.]NNE59633.1 helix-turn-helix domain-containing protein [Woeseia sp.]
MAKRDIGAEIIAGLKEYRDRPEKLKRYAFEPADVKGIRQNFGMTQQQFADFLMISVRTLQKWEQGERDPDGASHTLLRVMEKEPEAVKRALHG